MRLVMRPVMRPVMVLEGVWAWVRLSPLRPQLNRHLAPGLLHPKALDFGAGGATLICTLFDDFPWLSSVSGTDDTGFFEQVH
jgi:hypothetical protein